MKTDLLQNNEFEEEPTEETPVEETPTPETQEAPVAEETPTEELDVKVPGSMGLEYQTTDGEIDKGKPLTGPVERALRNIPVYKQFDQATDAAAQGVGDFIFDAVGLVPWLKPADQWWDANNPQSKDPTHTLVREVSAVVIPSLMGAGLIGAVGKATQARHIPAATRTLSSILAQAGIEVSIAGITSQSYEQDNAAAALNQMFGWNLPWATKEGMSPELRRHLHMYEAAGLSFGVDLILAIGSFGKMIKRFNQSDQAINLGMKRQEELRKIIDASDTSPVTDAVEGARGFREAAKKDEAVDRLIKNGDSAEYDPFINEPARPEQRAVSPETVYQPDSVGGKIDQYRIQNNMGTIDGQMRPIASKPLMDSIAEATDTSTRAKALGEFYNTNLSANADAIIDSKNISADKLNGAVDKLTEQLFNPELSFKQFQKIINSGKTMTFQGRKFLSEERWVEASYAWKNAHDLMFNPDAMRASAMMSQQAADTISSTARSLNLLDEIGTNSRQWEIMSEKMKFLVGEVTTNQDIVERSHQLKKLIEKGNFQRVAEWLNLQSDQFDAGIASSKRKAYSVIDEIERIAKDHPDFIRPLAEAYDATNGDINTLYKLHQWSEANISLLKKALWDRNPELPSFFIRGLHAIRYNSILNGLSPVRALAGNSIISTIKPISVFAGAFVSGDVATFKRAMWVYGGFAENFKRGFKMLGSDWRLANSNPEIAAKRGRITQKYMDDIERFQVMETMAEAWRRDGKTGKVAMWNLAKGLTHWNNWKYNRWGINALYSVDGFFKSLMASGSSRARAYDTLFTATNGKFNSQQFRDLQQHLYDQAFDKNNLLTDRAADFAHKELALNIDYAAVDHFESYLNHIPPAKSLFMFPRTGINAFELSWSFNPVSNLGPAITRARRTLAAQTADEIAEVMAEHGLDNTVEALKALQSEYIGRQGMGTTVVMGAGMCALEGNLTGNGPQDGAERKRMINMGWQPKSIKNPITGQWHSYRGMEPIESILALTADMIYQAERVDQSISEDWFRKLVTAITMNTTNSTFTAGFEPLVSLYSGDEAAWNRYLAQWFNTSMPGSGIRTILNNAISPQLRDVENEFLQQLANYNKFMFAGNTKHLPNLMDVYTGEPIRFHEAPIAAANALLPFFKQNGGMEPWRQWLLETGWDGLGEPRVDTITGEKLSPHARQWMNNWIGEHANLRGQVIEIMNLSDDHWEKELSEYKELLGPKGLQRDTPIKKILLHRMLDEIHTDAFDLANGAYYEWLENNDPTAIEKGILRQQVKESLEQGDLKEAKELKQELLNYK